MSRMAASSERTVQVRTPFSVHARNTMTSNWNWISNGMNQVTPVFSSDQFNDLPMESFRGINANWIPPIEAGHVASTMRGAGVGWRQ